ncbi:hypothetical protein D9C73_012208 [Collichthys lucidus]|uniref:Uncharacterized protein n=1 Tax=Collichthys lucidus TaxID=240159 RepID=A0A4U5UUR5_COLLU|nr:hypothetical protein D9C73_012208 [Collichthys lucidus]
MQPEELPPTSTANHLKFPPHSPTTRAPGSQHCIIWSSEVNQDGNEDMAINGQDEGEDGGKERDDCDYVDDVDAEEEEEEEEDEGVYFTLEIRMEPVSRVLSS